ncbi:oral-facial-digital syndrome 1 protein-like isoform X2 [Gigantopelta aegis]|uniref:oral-facial-digital syndrome 1 protein-like isoform X2 n=1 Tax=Gigantopelta aegis TaxID=1735272 RepID=UPI001B887828|nr:oral-facial-digital syndrome 1 protein-like isoform X2 [Gigantopelta aegis]
MITSPNDENKSWRTRPGRLRQGEIDTGRDRQAPIFQCQSQLRNSIVTELQTSFRGHLSLNDLKEPEDSSLLHRAANSLIASHLRHCHYDYSLSVFLPESGLAQDKIFSTEDLLQLLSINPHSKLHQKLLHAERNGPGKGLLWTLLHDISSLHARSTLETAVQTDLIRMGPVSSLDEKLHSLDELYSSKRHDHMKTGSVAVEDRLLLYQRQLEDRYNSELKRELARMKDNEIARIRLEEKDQCQRELSRFRKELEREYQSRYDALGERERNSLERTKAEQEMHEKENFTQRQIILEEIECVRQRENELKRETELNQREKKLLEERMRAKEDEIRRREQEVKRKEIEFEQRLQNGMAQFKLDTQARFIERTQNLEVREARVKELERLVSDEKSTIQSVKDELRDKTHRINELETLTQELRHSEVTATRQNEFINAKLRDMTDYNVTKEQNALMRNELETLRTRLSELLMMNERERGRQEELLRDLRRPSPETLMLQRDLERARESLRQEQLVFEQQKHLLEVRLKEEIDRNRELIQHYEEQTLQMKEMNREVVDLRQHLAMTNQALNNEVYRKPPGPDDARSVNLSQISQVSHHHAAGSHGNRSRSPHLRFEDKDVYNDVLLDDDYVMPKRYDRLSEDDDVSSTTSCDVIAETKYRLKNLEKEANNLELAYQDFHHQMTNVAAIPDPVTSSHSKGSRQDIVISPIASERPMSSTPYKQGHHSQAYQEDSFEELSGRKDRSRGESHQPIPKFDISNMSMNEAQTSQTVERKEKSRPITVSDLEVRPGSPSIVVVAGSESSAGHSPENAVPLQHRRTESALEPIGKPTGALPPLSLDSAWKGGEAPSAGILPPLSLDSAWKGAEPTGKLPSLSLDSAWKSEDQKKAEAQREAEEKRVWEEERQRREAERRRLEEEAWEREQQKLKELEAPTQSVPQNVEKKKEEKEEADAIDPVMQQYMDMVKQQKEKENEVAQKTVDTWGKGHDASPVQSDNEISVPEEKSCPASDDEFGW